MNAQGLKRLAEENQKLARLQSLEAAHHCLRHQYFRLQFKLKQEEESLERARAEVCVNAQWLKRFAKENWKLANECADLASQCLRREWECSLCDHNREALMEFGKEAEIRVHELEEVHACFCRSFVL